MSMGRGGPRSRVPAVRFGLLAGAALLLLSAGRIEGQEGGLRLRLGDADPVVVPADLRKGFRAVPVGALPAGLARPLSSSGRGVVALDLGGHEIRVEEGNPFVLLDGALLHLSEAPYRAAEELHLPAELFEHALPGRFPGWSLSGGEVRIPGVRTAPASPAPATPSAAPVAAPPGTPSAAPVAPSSAAPVAPSSAAPPVAPSSAAPPETPSAATPAAPAETPSAAPPATPVPATPVARPPVPPIRGRRVVIIDAGHGGTDPGTLGPGGVREKEVTLAIARALAAELRKNPAIVVRMTRDSDLLIPLWERGALATQWKGDGHGVFISIHANSIPERRSVRGFETFFLAEARTDDARRVAALENAPLALTPGSVDGGGDPALSTILNDLRNLDHQHWSALLAEFVQQELAVFHPGPNRGVKQGPFAVLTNALMPSILVEVGFLSHPDEARLLRREDFQAEVGRGVAAAVTRFFQRYPPGSATEVDGRGGSR